MYTLEFESVTKRYGHEIVVDDISFTVRPGRVTGLGQHRRQHVGRSDRPCTTPTKAGQPMQLHPTGGNLVTKSPFRLDPLTGQWRLNAFINAPAIRALNFGPHRPRRWALNQRRHTR